MFISLWRRILKNDHTSFPGNKLPKGRCLSFRPQIEALEDRMVPSRLTDGVHRLPPAESISAALAPRPHQREGSAASGALSGLQPIGSQPAGAGINEMQVTVRENSPATVIDLGSVFAGINGIQHEEELQLALLGNTNAGLVKTDLSDEELTLTYTPSRWGTATIMVSATDADGVSVQENILVTVLGPTSANGTTAGTSSISTGASTSMTPARSLATASVNTII